MKYFYIIITCLFATSGFGQTDISSGNVAGIWTQSNSPYRIWGEITIPNNSSLYIESGVKIIFQGHYKFNVKGQLKAIGETNDSILFTCSDTIGLHTVNWPYNRGWHGIRFEQTSEMNDSSIIKYCILEFANGTDEISHYTYDDHGGAVHVSFFSKLKISNCRLSNNYCYNAGGAIYCFYSNISILNCLISNNTINTYSSSVAGGIALNHSNAILINNIICNNSSSMYGGGLDIVNCDPIIINNTIANNECKNNLYGSGAGGGIYFYNSNGTIYNTIIYGNTGDIGNQIYIEQFPTPSSPNIYNCDVEGGINGFHVNNGFYFGNYLNNIDSFPWFVVPSSSAGFYFNGINADWSLSLKSPCINAGTIDTTGLNIGLYDIIGNNRISLNVIDIGALEYNLIAFIQNTNRVNNSIITYPNPLQDILTIQSNEFEMTSIFVYNYNGDLIKKITEPIKKLQINFSNNPNGIYYIVVYTGNKSIVKTILKM